jgi:polysaccharide export outer membrane protein
MKLSGILLVAIVIFFVSCSSQKKVPYNYIEDTRDTTVNNAIKNFEPVIQKNDLLSIQVYSNSTKPEISDALYNPPALSGAGAGTSSSGNSGGSANGYLVDINGDIKFPRLGTIHAEGLTKEQLADSVTTKIGNALENPVVIVRFLNYRISVLGEVGHPGTFPIPYEKVTIFEALSLAGDIPVTGKKTNVRVLREVNGNRQVGTIDLTSKDVFQSPYYNLQQNDVVLVDVKKSKATQIDEAKEMRRITLALSLISSFALLYNIFK